MKRIVYTRHDGGVSVCQPTEWAITWMGCGGFWNDKPRGFMEIQIERQIARGVPIDVARRYARAIQFGGCSTAEALEIIRDRDCHDGTAHELWDKIDLPDRWFRDAWSRSHNGGPISVDLNKAKPVQFHHIKSAQERENKRRSADLDLCLSPVEFDLSAIRQKIFDARDEIELRAIWPKELKP